MKQQIKTHLQYFLVTILLLLAFTNNTIAANLTATPDRTVIGQDETLQLSVRLDEQVGFGGPDFTALEQHFEIINQHRSNQFRSINGRTEGWTEWVIVLAPKSTGKLLVPSLNFEGAISDAIEITVNDAASLPAGQAKEVYVEMELSKDSIYVQEQLLVTYRIFSAIQVREISLAEAFSVEDANIEVVSETNFRRTIQGKPYRAYEVIYAIHPQKSSTLKLPALTWNLVTAGSRATWFNDPFRSSRGQVRRLRTNSREITVNPTPSNYSGVNWIPAANVELEQHWSSDPSRFIVGEPITRTLTFTAKGLAASQLPNIPQIDNDAIKVYSDQPQYDEIKSREGLTGTRIETSAIVPTQAGKFNLPPVRVTWWDTVNQREQIAELPSQMISVATAAIGDLLPAIDEPLIAPTNFAEGENVAIPAEMSWQNISLYWPLLASNAVFAILSMALFVAWLQARQKKLTTKIETDDDQGSTSLKQSANAVRLACGDNEPFQCKQALAQWGKIYWQLPHFASLQEIIDHSKDTALKNELENLDQKLYGKRASSAWQGHDLWQAINGFMKQHPIDKYYKINPKNDQLKTLYPNVA